LNRPRQGLGSCAGRTPRLRKATMKRAHLVLLAVLTASGLGAMAVVGCSSSSSSGVTTTPKPDGGGGGHEGGTGTDAGSCVAPFDAAAYADSQCGHPGDKGNSIGVGSFCVTSNDCVNCNGSANGVDLCSDLGGPGEYFCTKICIAPPDAGADGGGDSGCGENATCECQGAQCGCTPNSCL
jgi:hypothetical protein